MDTYTKQAQDFLDKTNTTLEIDYIGHGEYFDDDGVVGKRKTRDIYRFTLTRNGRKYTSKFGQSIVNSGTSKESFELTDKAISEGRMVHKESDYKCKRKTPTAYDIIACLTKYEVGDFDNFCSEFGYDTDSKKAENTYFAVQREYKGVCLIWNAKEREQLAEIN